MPPETDPLSDAQRTALLWRLYDALLAHLLKTLASDRPVKASLLDVCRAFLGANHINASTRPDLNRGLRSLATFRALPFDPADDKKN